MATINPPPMIFPKGTRDAKIPALATSASLVAIPALTSPRHGSRSLRSSRVDGESNDRSSRRQDGPNGARYFPNLSGQQGTCLISAQARLDQRTVRQVVEAHNSGSGDVLLVDPARACSALSLPGSCLASPLPASLLRIPAPPSVGRFCWPSARKAGRWQYPADSGCYQ